MTRSRLCIALALVAAALPLAACGGSATASEDEVEPAVLEQVEGTEPTRITLTRGGGRRGSTSRPRRSTSRAARGETVVPYAAVLYDTDGATFAYTSPEPLVFVRQPITVDRIDGDRRVSH